MIDVSKNTSLGRIERSITILGRKEGDSVDFAKLIYPPMQVADIFVQGINLAHSGSDQRKAQVIARDCALKLKNPLRNKKGTAIKPVAIHGHLIWASETFCVACSKGKYAGVVESDENVKIPSKFSHLHD